MRLMLDANILLDCLVPEASGLPRAGKPASAQVLTLCDLGVHQGLVAWHKLPIVAFYHGRQNSVFITRNTADFAGCAMPVMTPEVFLAAHP